MAVNYTIPKETITPITLAVGCYGIDSIEWLQGREIGFEAANDKNPDGLDYEGGLETDTIPLKGDLKVNYLDGTNITVKDVPNTTYKMIFARGIKEQLNHPETAHIFQH